MAKNKRGVALLSIGLSLFLIAGCFFIYNIVEDINAGKAAKELLSEVDDALGDENASNPFIMADGEAFCGKVIVEKLAVELPVFSEWDYAKLREAPCRYSGSAQTNDLIIAAHNYKSHFGNLKYLVIGDRIIFVDAYGTERIYEVREIITLDGIAISDMLEGDWDFTLFTCTKGGEHRVTVRCEEITN